MARSLIHRGSQVLPFARAALVSAALLLNVFLFFKPITKISKARTETAVRWADGYIGGLIDGMLSYGLSLGDRFKVILKRN